MIVKRRLMAGLSTFLLSIGAGAFVATTPAQAALANCPFFSVPGFCLYDVYGDPSEWPYPGNTSRNTCIPLESFDDDMVYNLTNTRWYVFRTTTCNGSHGEIPPGYAGLLPRGYDFGQTHAIMRTSRTS